MRFSRMLSPWLAVRLLAVACLLIIASSLAAIAQQQRDYWLTRGGTIVGACPGNAAGEPLRAANNDGQWILITGVVTCRDVSKIYSFDVSFLGVEINPRSRGAINRDVLNFDWLGLAVFRAGRGGREIEWLYDEALPIRGALQRSTSSKIFFGNLRYEVPTSDVQRASNFLFYLTAEGVIFPFGLL